MARRIVRYDIVDTFRFDVRLGTGTVHKPFDKKTGLADPFIRIGETFTLGWDFKSKVCRDTLKPEWNETASFQLKRTNGAPIKLAIEAIDYDPGIFDANDFIGRAEIDALAGFQGALNLNGKDGVCYATINELLIAPTLVHTEKVPVYEYDKNNHGGHGHSHHGHSHSSFKTHSHSDSSSDSDHDHHDHHAHDYDQNLTMDS